MPSLRFRSDGEDRFTYPLRGGRTLIGRSDRCDVALPSQHISRTHCAVESRADGWWLVDRSMNGTLLNGTAVSESALKDGDVIGLGEQEAMFLATTHATDSRTYDLRTPRAHEELVDAANGHVAAYRARICFAEGRHAGRIEILERSILTIGGPGSKLVIDEALPASAVRIRVVRGRVMVEPGLVPVFLGGIRVREITPALIGEEIRLGDHAFTVEAEVEDLRPKDREEFGTLVGKSPIMKQLFATLERMAAHDDPVLITGDSGTGKELAAHALHDCSGRFEGPFVAVNCAAITDTLFESELFGHEKGSFTGAVARQDGAFQRAEKGTLFLDEVGELRPEMQAKLLRALESGEVRRVGGLAPEYPDVRVVAATNRDLPTMVRAGAFRADLYFRLAVLSVRMPALRDRRIDIPLLAATLLKRIEPNARLEDKALTKLALYDWPGNVRELRNVLTRTFVMGGPLLLADALEFLPGAFDAAPPGAASNDDFERSHVLSAMRNAGGNRTKAARELGIPRSSLLYRLRRLGLDGA